MGFFKTLYKQKILYIIFVCILMFTNTVLLFTEHMGVFAKIAFILIPLGVQMLLLALVKKPGKVFLFLLPKCILDAFQLVLIKLFGGSIIAVDMFLNLATTSAKESGELLSNIMPIIILLLAIYIPAIFLAVKSVRQKEAIASTFRKRALKTAGIFIMAGIAAVFAAKCTHKGFKARTDLYPYNVLYNLDFAIKKYDRILHYPKTSEDFTFGAQRDTAALAKYKGEREIYVLILGETARAVNWHSYGYERNTTPQTDTIPHLIRYRDVLTQSNTTHKIVPMVLSAADARNFDIIYKSKSIITAFKEAGFKTIFLSNQNYNKSFAYYHFHEADIKVSLKEKNDSALDHELLPFFDNAIEKDTTSNLFIILHLYGSHFNYHERYEAKFRKFVPDRAERISSRYKTELWNSYDNSILSTDDLIARIIHKIEEVKSPGTVLYLSDHGEDMLDDKRERFLHASPVPTFYQLQIPYLVWMSDAYIANNPQKYRQAKIHSNYPISNNTVFHSLLDLASIQTPYLDSTLSVSSPALKIVPREYLNDHDGCTRIDQIHFTKYDYEQFRKRGIELH